MDIQTNTTGSLTNHGTALECIIDSLNAIVLHRDEEARAELGVGCTSVEQRRRSMGEVTLRHKVIGLDDTLEVGAVNTDSDTHDHMLRALGNTSVETEEVGPLEGFETKATVRRQLSK